MASMAVNQDTAYFLLLGSIYCLRKKAAVVNIADSDFNGPLLEALVATVFFDQLLMIPS